MPSRETTDPHANALIGEAALTDTITGQPLQIAQRTIGMPGVTVEIPEHSVQLSNEPLALGVEPVTIDEQPIDIANPTIKIIDSPQEIHTEAVTLKPAEPLTQGSAAEQADKPKSRIRELRQIVDEIAGDGELSPETRDFLRDGNSITDALKEIAELGASSVEGYGDAPTEKDEILNSARLNYAQTLRGRRRRSLTVAETDYKEAVIKNVLEKTDVDIKQETSYENLTTVQLAATADILLQERKKLATLIEGNAENSKLFRLLSNKKVRYGLLGTIVGASLATHFGALPIESEEVIHLVEQSLEATTSYVLVLSGQSHAARGYRTLMNKHEQKRDERKLQKDPEIQAMAESTTGQVVETSVKRPYSDLDARRFIEHVYGKYADRLKEITADRSEMDMLRFTSQLVEDEVVRSRKELGRARFTSAAFHAVAIGAALAYMGPSVKVAESATQGREAMEGMNMELERQRVDAI
jgi:hypothetical protein